MVKLDNIPKKPSNEIHINVEASANERVKVSWEAELLTEQQKANTKSITNPHSKAKDATTKYINAKQTSQTKEIKINEKYVGSNLFQETEQKINNKSRRLIEIKEKNKANRHRPKAISSSIRSE